MKQSLKKKPETMLVSARIDADDYKMLAEAAKHNNRSLAGEIRNRILGTTTAQPIEQSGDMGESQLRKEGK